MLNGMEIIDIDNKTETISFFPKRETHIQNIAMGVEKFQVEAAANEVLKTLDELSGQNIVWAPQGSVGEICTFLEGCGIDSWGIGRK